MKGLKLLLWKNWKLVSRTKVQCLLEICLPIIFGLLSAILRAVVTNKKFPEPPTYEPFKIRGNIPDIVREKCDTIYYTPSNPLTDNLIGSISEEFFLKQGLNYSFQGFSSKTKLVQSYLASVAGFSGDLSEASSPVLAAIIFQNFGTNFAKLPQQLKYTLRFPSYQRTEYEAFKDRGNYNPSWSNRQSIQPYRFPGPRSRKSNYGGYPGYFEEGFLYLQLAVEATLTKLLLNNNNDTKIQQYEEYDIRLQRFPFSAFLDDSFAFVSQIVSPFLLVSAFVLGIMSLTRQIVHEKATKLKEFMKILGLSNWLHWTAWFIRTFIMLTISAAGITIFLKLRLRNDTAFFTETDPFIIFLVFNCFSMGVIGFCFLMSTLFAAAETAATAAAIVWLLKFLMMLTIFFDFGILSRWEIILKCVGNAAVPMAVAFQLLTIAEGTGIGIQWKDVWTGFGTNDNLCLGDVMLVMIFNGILYMLLGWYIELVFPGPFGVPLPWYFPFTKWFWTGQARSGVENGDTSSAAAGGRGGVTKLSKSKKRSVHTFIEKEPKGLKVGVEMRDLTKVFCDKKITVNGINLKMFEGQVTGLLGHNGAGKTTVMSILTGMITPSSGRAWVNSFDIRKDMRSARQSLGLCPQYNVLMDSLTVEEHLKFFCMLKDLTQAETIEETDRMLNVLELQDKRGAEAKTLSGGMKRKLSVGVAFCAGSKVVLLDEPTAGMDVGARRSTWDLIQAEKTGRTVILSTHYMEEADLLGDRIAIMADGTIQCCGSSLFLKSKYGGDYNLTIVKEKTCNPLDIQRTVERFIPGASLNQDIGAEFRFTLPVVSVDRFSALFQELDDQKGQLGITSYGVGSMSMEEIFLRVGILAEQAKSKKKSLQKGLSSQSFAVSIASSQVSVENVNSFSHCGSTDPIFDHGPLGGQQDNRDRNDGITLFLQQFRAMLTKKVLLSARNSKVLLLQVVKPFFVVAFMLNLLKGAPGVHEEKELVFNFEMPHLKKTSLILDCPDNSMVCQSMKLLVEQTSCPLVSIQEYSSMTSFLTSNAERSISTLNREYMLGFEEKKIF